jgi:hypothetical protein
MALQAHEIARRDEAAIELRDEPLRVRWMFKGLTTSDSHDVSCLFTASARVVPENIERRMLAEVLLADRAVLTQDDIAAHFQPALQSAAEEVVARSTAPSLLAADSEARKTLLESLKSAARPVAFACGLELLAPFALEFHSESFQRQKIRSMQQSLMEQQRAGELEHLERAADLLKRFEAIRSSAPGLSAGRVLDQISPADRGAMLHTLQLAAARGRGAVAQTLWIVAGPTLAKLDPADPMRQPELMTLPTELGPLRSVQSARIEGTTTLLVGAQRGFFAIQPPALDKPKAYLFPGLESPLGFNKIVARADGSAFFGSHSDAGVAQWNADKPSAPTQVVPPARFLASPFAEQPSNFSQSISTGRGPKHLCAIDDRLLLFAAGALLFTWDGQQIAEIPTDSRSEVVGILSETESLLIVRDDGAISRLDCRPPHELQEIQHRPVRLRAAGALPWMDSQRLLLASEDGAIACVGLEDQLVTEFVSPHRGARIVAGSSSLVAAVSPDRQRVILWNAWDGQRPLTEIYLAARTRHRIADLVFADQ